MFGGAKPENNTTNSTDASSKQPVTPKPTINKEYDETRIQVNSLYKLFSHHYTHLSDLANMYFFPR